MKNSGTVRMETKRLVLRPYVIEDADAMFRNWANDPQVTKYLSWEPHKDVEETKQILEGWIKSYESKDFYTTSRAWAITSGPQPWPAARASRGSSSQPF